MASRDIVRAIQDLTNLDWNERASSSGTAGTYLKARAGSGSRLLAPLAGGLERIAAFDPLADVATTNFVGSRSLEENLRTVSPVEGVEDLNEARIAELFDGLEGMLSGAVLLKMQEIIQRRWARYEEIRADR